MLLANLGGIDAHLAAAAEVRAAGLGRVWLAETRGPDAFVAAALIAREHGLEVGTAIVPTSTRTPAVLAMAAADLAAVSGRPVHLGLGAGGQVIVERWHGQPFGHSVERLEDTIAILRQALAGERTGYRGTERSSDGFTLSVPPRSPVLLYVGGMGPRMVELAARAADGVILTWISAARARERAEEVRKLEAAAGRPAGATRVVFRAYVAVTDDPAAVREGVRRELVEYVASPAYGRWFRSVGFGREVDAVADAFRVGDRAASLAAISDELVDEVLVVGDAATVRAGLDAYAAAGADDVMVQPVPESRGGDLAATVRALAA